jgi:hypothetical protein
VLAEGLEEQRGIATPFEEQHSDSTRGSFILEKSFCYPGFLLFRCLLQHRTYFSYEIYLIYAAATINSGCPLAEEVSSQSFVVF